MTRLAFFLEGKTQKKTQKKTTPLYF